MRITSGLLLALLLALTLAYRHPHSDFDFGSGLVRCGVGGLSVSCGSVAP